MQYLLLIYEGDRRFAELTPSEQRAELAEYTAFSREFRAAVRDGNALQSVATATTVRMREGRRLITDGPFTETKEQLGGYYVVEADDLDEAIAMAAKLPGARTGAIEIRPIIDLSRV
jgi:hypothetical protein